MTRGNPGGALSRVNIRKSHPALYRSLMAFAVIEVLLAFNFLIFTPTFTPRILIVTPSKFLIAGIFLTLGVMRITFLNVHRDLRKVRRLVAISVGFSFCWGIANTQQIAAGRASGQLPIYILGFCFAQLLWLIEAPVNPMTERGK